MNTATSTWGGRFGADLRAATGRVSLELNVGRRWSKPTPQPEDAVPLEGAPLYGIIGTWCEEDVIGATVANAFAQGCDRVFLVDNDSPDGTVREAERAGAEVACVYATDFWDDRRKMSEMMAVINKASAASDQPHVWWMLCDADEFPHGPGGRTIADHLAALDRRFRVVGARVFNHFPSGEPAYASGRHPLDFQPLCHEVRMAWCSLRHWKHPLVRWDRDGAPITPRVGFHRADCCERVLEPVEGIYLHHFPFRRREQSEERLRRLFDRRAGEPARAALEDARQKLDAARRFATIEDVYAGNWSNVDRPVPGGQKRGVKLRPWDEQTVVEDVLVARWYPLG